MRAVIDKVWKGGDKCWGDGKIDEAVGCGRWMDE